MKIIYFDISKIYNFFFCCFFYLKSKLHVYHIGYSRMNTFLKYQF